VTILNVGLSGTLQAELAQPGVSAYAVWFDADEATPQWTTLVDDGTIENSGTVAVALPDPMEGGKVYFIIQSGSAASVDNLPAVITQQSELNWSNAALYDFSYDSFEVTLSDTSSDVGNLSSINGFALPIGVGVPFTNGTTATIGYGVSGADIASAIQTINPSAVSIYDFDTGPLQGQFRMALSPTIAVTPGQMLSTPVPFSDADWAAYVTSLEGPQAGNIVLSGLFNGAQDAKHFWHNGGLFIYQLSWDAAASTFWLDPLPGSQIQGDIRITPDQLEQSIYSTLGTVDIYSGGSVYLADMNTGLNNQWGKVLSEFLTGFTGGFYGTAAQSPNPQIAGTIDLDRNINWDPNYAFGQMVAPDSQPPVADDAYSRIFYTDTNSYGSGYSDALMSQYALGGPQIPVAEPGTSTDVPAIDLTIYANDETPSPDSAFGYTAPVIYDYIAPLTAQGGVYATPDDTTSGANIGFDFASSVANNAGVVLAASDTVTLSILASDTGGQPLWDKITLDGALAGPLGLWQRWDISGSAGNYIAMPTPDSEPAGSLLITNLPIADQGVAWYEIGVGNKVFDLYTTSLNGQFENPNYADNQGEKTQAGALAVDGLAQVIAPVYAPTPQAILTFTVDFSPNDSVAFDPSLLVANTANADTVHPAAPVAGSLVDGGFVALAGQSNLVSNSVTAGTSRLAFAWTGENNSAGAGTPSWISGYTNKIDAGDIARITLSPQAGSPVTTTATADVDGQWQTGEVDLGVGTYTVTMQAFLPDDTSFANPVTAASDSLILTETGIGDEQPCFLAGTRIATPRGEVLVDSLMIGDLVLTRNGRIQPIAWIGHSRIRVHPGRRTAATPVLVRRDALADGAPNRDLRITKGHSLYLDGVLIPAEFLVNHRSIVWDDRGQTIDIYHIELPDHDVLLANGAAAESYRDDGNRWLFHNAHTGWDQPPKPPCAPVLTGGAVVDAIWRRLLRRSGLWLDLPTTAVSDLHLNADGVRIDGRDCGQGLFLFRLLNSPHRLRIISRAAAPDVLGVARDPRVLGVALRRIALWQAASVRLLDMTEPALQDGFHAVEPDNAFRWTNGAALLPTAFLSGLSGAFELELKVAGTARYPQQNQPHTKAA
jgi:Hint domain